MNPQNLSIFNQIWPDFEHFQAHITNLSWGIWTWTWIELAWKNRASKQLEPTLFLTDGNKSLNQDQNVAAHILQDNGEDGSVDNATSRNRRLYEIEEGLSSIVKSSDSRTGSQVGAKQRQKFLMQFRVAVW